MSPDAGSAPFEARDSLTVYYRYGYGGFSPFFRAIVEDSQLLVTRCDSCNKAYCPPRPQCMSCWQDTTWEAHSGQGVVVSRSYCYWAPSNADLLNYTSLPYVYGLIKLDGVSSHLNTLIHVTDRKLNKGVSVGDRVHVDFREHREGKISDFYFRVLDT